MTGKRGVNMGEIEPFPNGQWSAHAALKDAMDCVDSKDAVLIIFNNGKKVGHRAANLTIAEMIYLIESLKFRTFVEFEL